MRRVTKMTSDPSDRSFWSLLLRDERLPSLVIIEDANLSNTALRFVNDFYFLLLHFQSCISYTIKRLGLWDDGLWGR